MYLTNLTRRVLPVILGLILSTSIYAQDNLIFEDFEDANVSYTTSPAEFSDGSGDFFTRTDGSNISGGYSVSGIQGTSYFAAQDVDGAGADIPVELYFTGDISNYTDLVFSIFLAEDDDGSSQDWDAADYMKIEYSIDEGPYLPAICVAASGAGSNMPPYIDSDCDGTGDGAEITDIFTNYSANISESGSSITIRIQIGLNSGDEDIAIDNVLLTGNPNSDPNDTEPPVALCAALGTVTVELDQSGIATVNAEDLDGGSTDNVGIASFEASPSSFNCGEMGAQAVTLTITDTNGNTSTCATDVQVVDLLGPVISVNEIVTVTLDASGNVLLDVNAFNNGTTDNCGINSLSVSPSSLNCSNVSNPNLIASDLIMSEYVEGSGNNKYIEIYNGTGADVDMADYYIELYNNGSTSANSTDFLGAAGILANGETAVFSNSQANIYPGTHYNSSVAGFNGNDMLVLWHGDANQSVVIDAFGIFGNDPGAEWEKDGVRSANHTLRRKKSIVTGNIDPLNQDFLTEWEQFDIDDVSDLGNHNFESSPSFVTFSAADNNGNISSQSVQVNVIDNIAPQFLSQPADIVLDSPNGECAQVVDYTYPDVEDNCSGNVTITSDYPSGELFYGGVTVVTLTATDPGGNTDQVQFTVTISNEPLSVSIGSISNIVCYGYPLSLDALVEGGCKPYSYEWDNVEGQQTYKAHSGGDYTVVVTDANGETATASITTFDNPEIVIETSQINPSCSDGNDGSFTLVNISGGTAPYRHFWFGQQILEQTGEDAVEGGSSFTDLYAGGKITLHVMDTVGCENDVVYRPVLEDLNPPTAICGSTTLTLDASGTAILDPADLNGGSTDDCGTLSFSASQETFDCTNLGDNEVTLFVADDSLNTSTCLANVTVIDNLPPELSVNSSLNFTLNNSGQVVIDASLFDNGSTDNCGITEFSVDPSTLTCADLGEGPALATDLIISEYIEGSSNNKYIEVFNGTGISVDLSNYELRLYSNGASNPSSTGTLSPGGTLADGETAVFKGSSANIYGGTSYSNNAVNFNGDDAVALYNTNTGQNIDVFGVIGQDPGSAWSGNGNSTVNKTLRRLASVTEGNTNPTNANFLDEWEQFNQDDVNGLGSHSLSGGGGTEITFTATDASGNSSSTTVTAIVIDDISPVFSSFPANIAAVSDATTCSAIVNWAEPVATDNCEVTIESDYASGDSFGAGETTVMYTATDPSGNSVSQSFTITVSPQDLMAEVVIDDNIHCNGSTAEVHAEVTGGCEPYSFEWDGNAGSGTQTVSAGDHTLELTDVNGNTLTVNFSVSEPLALAMTLDATDPTCGTLSNGEITAIASGGTPSYSIIWSGDATGTGNTLSGIGNGTYTATVTDLEGCTTSETVTLNGQDNTPPTAICGTATLSLNEYGEAILDPADIDGGSSDNCGTVSFSASQTYFDCSNVGTNLVTVTVTDEAGMTSTCTATIIIEDHIAPIFIEFPDDIVATSDPATCSAVVTWPFPEALENCAVYILADYHSGDAFPVGVTTVTYTATDLSGLNVVQSFTVTVTAEDLLVSISQDDDILCNGGTANLSATVSGGCQPYEYSWDGQAGGASLSANGGLHTLIVTDASGATASANITVAEPSAIVATLSSIDPSCGQSTDGEASVAVSGGTVPYSIIWSGDATGTGNTLSSIGNGTYTATITDDNGCTMSESVTLDGSDNTPPTAICGTATLSLNEYGEAILDPADIDGGSSDNCGTVSFSASQTYFDCSNVGTNLVTVTVTDEAGMTNTCTATIIIEDHIAPIFIEFPDDIVATSDPATCSAVVTWPFPEALENCAVYILADYHSGDAFPVGVTTVTYTATDLSGLNVVQSFTVTVTAEDLLVSISQDDDILCNGGTANLSAMVSGGCQPYEYSWDGQAGGASLSANGGLHTLLVTDASGATASANITVAEPSAIVATFSSIDPSCGQSTDGEASVAVSGGSAPYSIAWSGDATGTGNTLSSIGNGTYTATITDDNGCTTSESVMLDGQDDTPPTAICGNATLSLDANGEAVLNPSALDGGSFDNCGAVSFSVSQTAFDCSNIGSNSVTLTVTDEAGLTSTCTATVTVVDNLAPVIATQDIDIALDLTGFALVGIGEIYNGGSDNCGLASLEISSGQTQYGCEDIGQTFAVTLTASDFSGNTTNSVAQVTVVAGDDSDGDGVSDACDICLGDDSLGDADGDGICDSFDICDGAETITYPTMPCNYQTTLTAGSLYASGYLIYCIDGTFTNNYIQVASGTTIRVTGSGTLRVNLASNAAIEVMAGSDITFNTLNLGWNAKGMVVNHGATVHLNNFQSSQPVVNCGTINCNQFTLGYNSTFLNNGTLNCGNFSTSSSTSFENNGTVNASQVQIGYGSAFENNGDVYADAANGNNTIDGSLVNHGTYDMSGKLNLSYNGNIENYCTVNVGKDFAVGRDVTNYALISVGQKSTLSYNGRVLQYSGAMFQTASTKISGKFIGYGTPSLVKVLGNTTADWNARIQGSIYFCDENGIESASNPNALFQGGALESCFYAIPVSECNPIGHIVLPTFLITNADTRELGSDGIDINGNQISGGTLGTSNMPTDKVAITIYPNPTEGKARITFTPEFDSGVTIRVYDMSGKKLEEFIPGDQIAGQPYEAKIDLSKYANGVYYIQITDQTRSETKKLVLAK